MDLDPLLGMTWMMLAEASIGAAVVNRGLNEYQLLILAAVNLPRKWYESDVEMLRIHRGGCIACDTESAC